MEDENMRADEADAPAGSEAAEGGQEQTTEAPAAGKKRGAGKGMTSLLGSLGKTMQEGRAKGKQAAVERPVDHVRVSDNALASIIGLSAHEVPGVVGMAPASISEGLRRILGARQVDEGVVVEHPHGEGRADVELHVVVAYGVNIPVVADSVRERVRYAAEHYAGIVLDKVRVKVVGVSRG